MAAGLRLLGPLSRLGLTIAAAVLIVDQATKFWLLERFDIAAAGRVAVAPFFDLVLVWNRGISYGLFPQDGDLGRWVLVGVKLSAAIILGLLLARTSRRITALAFGLIIGGALGNAIDRIVHGAVADFFLLHWRGFEWYVFNVADVAIVAGVIGLLYESVFDRRKNAANTK